jgi:hypothetical protein
MSLYIDKYLEEKEGTNGYWDDDGCYYEVEDPLGFIQTGLLGHCGCGDLGSSLRYLAVCLQALKDKNYKNPYHSDGERYTIWYLLCRSGLTEHGSSVPGWLTKHGEGVLSDLNKLLGGKE